MAKADTANNALVDKVVHKINVQPAHGTRIEHRVPVFAGPFVGWRQLKNVEFGELVTDGVQLLVSVLVAVLSGLGRGNLVRRRRRRTCYTR